MGIIDKLQGEFSSLPPFAEAVSAGVQDELEPLRADISALRTEVANLQTQLLDLSANIQAQAQSVPE